MIVQSIHSFGAARQSDGGDTYEQQGPDGVVEEDDGGEDEHGGADCFVELHAHVMMSRHSFDMERPGRTTYESVLRHCGPVMHGGLGVSPDLEAKCPAGIERGVPAGGSKVNQSNVDLSIN